MSRDWTKIRRWVVGLFAVYVAVKAALYFTGHPLIVGWLAESVDAGFFVGWAYCTGRVDQDREHARQLTVVNHDDR